MEIKERITETAAEMFFRFGIRSITMDEIAEALGMSKRTLYESFSNKEELLLECIEWQYQKGLKQRDEIVAKYGDNPLEVMAQNFRHAMLLINSMHPNFINDLQKYHSGLWNKHVKSKQQENISFTETLLQQGQEKGLFRRDAHMEILSKMIHGVMPMLSAPDLFPENRYVRSEVFRQVLLNFIRGLATVEGLKMIDEKFTE